jgi:hypothetical protein
VIEPKFVVCLEALDRPAMNVLPRQKHNDLMFFVSVESGLNQLEFEAENLRDFPFRLGINQCLAIKAATRDCTVGLREVGGGMRALQT